MERNRAHVPSAASARVSWYWQPRFLIAIALVASTFSVVVWILVFTGASSWPTTVPETNDRLDGQSIVAIASVVGAGIGLVTGWITLRSTDTWRVRLVRVLGLASGATVAIGLIIAVAR